MEPHEAELKLNFISTASPSWCGSYKKGDPLLKHEAVVFMTTQNNVVIFTWQHLSRGIEYKGYKVFCFYHAQFLWRSLRDKNY
jgi:hypothetical protein